MKIKEGFYKGVLRIQQKRKAITDKNYRIGMWLYPSWWHSKLFQLKRSSEKYDTYYSARPNPGAGIGHQMANWIAGYWYAKNFKLKFAHLPFSNSAIPFTESTWESFLNFGANEASVKQLIQEKGYKLVRLPIFHEGNQFEISTIEKIIDSYRDEKVILIAEQDQFYRDQYGVMADIQSKFYSSEARKNETLVFNPDEYNIAVHVRRGDIVQHAGKNNPNLTLRWLDNDYFVIAVETAIEYIKTDKKIHLYIFSQATKEELMDFKRFDRVTYCTEMSAQDSFLHMVYADALVTSKSSFSYKPALLNKGIKFCPADFWHGYPRNKDWILLDDKGMRILE